MLDIPCVIFAGGQSSRMGQDKALLPFGTYPSLAEFQYQRLSQLFKHVYISCKRDKFDFQAKLIEDLPYKNVSAPTLGFISSFRYLQSARIFVISVDTPFLGEKEIVELVAEDAMNLDAVIAKTAQGMHPLCGIYHRSLLPTFETMLEEGNHRLGKFLKNVNTRFVSFEDEVVFSNLNHPHEYEAALRRC